MSNACFNFFAMPLRHVPSLYLLHNVPCSKKVTASSVWAFADTSGGRGVDSASYAAGFLPLLLTTHGKANLAKFPGISFRVFVTEFDKNGRISSVLQ